MERVKVKEEVCCKKGCNKEAKNHFIGVGIDLALCDEHFAIVMEAWQETMDESKTKNKGL